MLLYYRCEECGKEMQAHGLLEALTTITGRVIVDGHDNNLQSVVLCESHRPDTKTWRESDVTTWQPQDCKHIRFYWPNVRVPLEPVLPDTETDEQDNYASDAEIEQVWREVYADQLMPNGQLNLKELKAELFEYVVLSQEVSKVYDTVTGGVISKPTTNYQSVVDAVDEHYRRLYDAEEKDRSIKMSIMLPRDSQLLGELSDLIGRVARALDEKSAAGNPTNV